jgi:hypothetical protein
MKPPRLSFINMIEAHVLSVALRCEFPVAA